MRRGGCVSMEAGGHRSHLKRPIDIMHRSVH
jgi:hypothetical protein